MQSTLSSRTLTQNCDDVHCGAGNFPLRHSRRTQLALAPIFFPRLVLHDAGVGLAMLAACAIGLMC